MDKICNKRVVSELKAMKKTNVRTFLIYTFDDIQRLVAQFQQSTLAHGQLEEGKSPCAQPNI